MNWTLDMDSHMKLEIQPCSQITFLAKHNDLLLRQRFQVSCNKGQAKNEGRCVDVMSSERYCKRIIMSGVGAHTVSTTVWKNNPGQGVFDQFDKNNLVRLQHPFEAGEARWNTQ